MTSFDYRAAVERARTAAAAYYDGDTEVMTDADYDALLDAIAAHEAEHPDEVIEHGLFTAVAGGESAGGDVEHAYPMLSLEKVKTEAELRAFLATITAVHAGAWVSVEPKIDGMAISVDYIDGVLRRAVTRGDGRKGEDVTDRLLRSNVTVFGLPRRLSAAHTLSVRGELFMSGSDFEVSNANRVAAGKAAFANPRNATAGTVRAQTLDYDVALSFLAHDLPLGLGLEASFPSAGLTVHSSTFRADDADGVLAAINAFGVARAEFNVPTDGVVVKAVATPVREALGEGSRAPKWAVAYKYEAQQGRTVLRDIEMAVGRTGNISFTAILDPVQVDGSVVSRATLHNFDFIAANDLRIGDTVLVWKAGDIIPRVERALVEFRDGTQVPYDPPRVSPSGAPLDTSTVIWRSTDPTESIGSLITYAASRDVLDIDGLGGEIAAALVESGLVADLADLFTVTADQLAALPLGATVTGATRVLGAKTAAKLHANIQSAKSAPVARVITALGIRLSGRTFGRRLAARFGTLPALASATIDDLLQVEGVGPDRARVFRDGLDRLAPVIARLTELGIGLGDADEMSSDAAVLAGMSVVATGTMDGPLATLSRNEVNELIERHGGRASGSVSKNTSLVVAGDGAGSKLAKANDLGVRVVTPEEFAAMLGMV